MKRLLLHGVAPWAIAAAFSIGGVAYAQTTPPPAPAEVQEVVVTGSLIRGTPEDAALPVDVVGAEELDDRARPPFSN